MKKIFLLLLSLPSFVMAQQLNCLTVRIVDVKSAEGTLNVGIYDSERDAFAMDAQLVGTIKPAQKGVMEFTYSLPKGNYAVGVIHDLNRDGLLNKNFLGLPKEPYGFSGKATRPIYKDAQFRLVADTIITISLH